MTGLSRRKTLALVASSLPLGAAAIGSTGASNHDSTASIEADPATAGSTATHAVTLSVESAGGSSWTSLVVDYSGTGADASNVGTGDVATLGIDRGDDASGTTVDVDASDDLSSVSASNDGSMLRIGLGGNYSLEAGDEVVAVYGDVQNPPSEGSYDVPIVANEQSAADRGTGTLEIDSAGGGSGGDGSDGSDGEDSEDSATERCDAEIVFCDQSTPGRSVTVKRVHLPEGGYIVLHGEEGGVYDHSSYLEAGTHHDVKVPLGYGLDDGLTLTAMAHEDSDGDQTYCLNDDPYTCDGDPVSDDAEVMPGC